MLIEGLELINKIEIMKNHPLILPLAALFLALGFGCLILSCNRKITPIFLTILFFVGAIALFDKYENPSIPTGEYYYEVILDDTVNLKEFYQTYEIIEIKGDLYTIKEK